MKLSDVKVPTRKILIIEDEGDMCLLINLLLYGENTSINHVKSIAHALTYLKNEQPSLIVLDNRLPDGFGLDFIAYLKANYPDVKIVMISGSDMEARDVALEIGADSFLAKPFTKKELQDSIDELLN